jgi:hypothetical protein
MTTTARAVAAAEATLAQARQEHSKEERAEWIKRLGELRAGIEADEERLQEMARDISRGDAMRTALSSELTEIRETLVDLYASLPKFSDLAPTEKSKQIREQITELGARRTEALKRRETIPGDRQAALELANQIAHKVRQARVLEGLLDGTVETRKQMQERGFIRL